MHPVGVIGWGAHVVEPGGVGRRELVRLVRPYLEERKLFKFMGTQDILATIAAGRALSRAAVPDVAFADRMGLYLAVGYIPFAREDIEPLARASSDGGSFSMARFAEDGIAAVHPLLTFRCLPNMPAFHVSFNFGIHGPAFVTYPGIGQFYTALERAAHDLAAERIDYAVVGGVADQDNFLVDRLFERLPGDKHPRRADAAGVVVLARGSGGMHLEELHLAYEPRDPMEGMKEPREEWGGETTDEVDLGPASLAVHLATAIEDGASGCQHRATTRDGFLLVSRWSRS